MSNDTVSQKSPGNGAIHESQSDGNFLISSLALENRNRKHLFKSKLMFDIDRN